MARTAVAPPRRARRDVLLGDFAARLGYLSAYERLVIVGRQLRHCARIGAVTARL